MQQQLYSTFTISIQNGCISGISYEINVEFMWNYICNYFCKNIFAFQLKKIENSCISYLVSTNNFKLFYCTGPLKYGAKLEKKGLQPENHSTSMYCVTTKKLEATERLNFTYERLPVFLRLGDLSGGNVRYVQ